MRATPLFVTIVCVCASCTNTQFSTVQDPAIPTCHCVKNHPFHGEGKTTAEWWSAFVDPQLQALLTEAEANNFDISLAYEKIRQVSYQYGLNEAQAEAEIEGESTLETAAALPDPVSGEDPYINAYLVGNNIPRSLGGTASSKFNVQFFKGSFGIDLFNAMEQQLIAAKSDILQYGEAAEATTSMIRNQISQQYITLRLNQNLQEYLQTAGNSLQTLLNHLQDRIGAGLNTAQDAVEGNDFLQQIRVILFDVENNIQNAITNIATLIGSNNTDAVADIVGSIGPIPQANENLLAGTPLDVVKNRADLRAKYVQLQHANAELNVVMTEQFPSITINAALESSASHIMKLLNGRNLSHAFGIQFTPHILNTKENTTNLRVQKSKLIQAQLEYNKAIVNALAQVGNSMSRVIAARKKDNVIRAMNTKLHNTVQEATALTQQNGQYIPKLISAHKNKMQADISSMQSAAGTTHNMLDLLSSLGG